MNSRLGLGKILHKFCDNVYFQPPNGYQIKYPCIIYERRSMDTIHADNLPYRVEKGYTITVIDPDPDSIIPDKVAMLPMCRQDRSFTSDNLNHTTFTIYY